MRKKTKELTALLCALWITGPIAYNLLADPPKAKLDYERRPDSDATPMNYFICGLFAQPRPAFTFAEDLTANEGVAYLPYLQTGTDLRIMADLIIADIEINHYQQIKIWSISIGDVVATRVEDHFTKAENPPKLIFIKANPCTRPDFVAKPLSSYLKPISIAAYLARYLSGPLGFIPWIKTYKEKYSLILASEITKPIAFTDDIAPLKKSRFPRCVIVSEDDKLLDNSAITDFYENDYLYFIPSPHGATETHSGYHDATADFFNRIAAP